MNNPIKEFLNEVETKVLAQGTDVVSMIKTDHRKVEALFNDFNSQSEESEKLSLAKAIINELTAHSAAEESKVYPILDKEDHKGALESLEEHSLVKKLLGELRGMNSVNDKFEAKMKVLFEVVKHHVKEEEEQYLPELHKSGEDLDEVGAAFDAEKERIFHQPMKNGMVPEQGGDSENKGAGKSKKGGGSSSTPKKSAAMKKRSSAGKTESKSSPKTPAKKSSKNGNGKSSPSRKIAAVAKTAKDGVKKAKEGVKQAKASAKKVVSKAKKTTEAVAKKAASTAKKAVAGVKKAGEAIAKKSSSGGSKKATTGSSKKSASPSKKSAGSSKKSAGSSKKSAAPSKKSTADSKKTAGNVRSIKKAPKRKAS